MPVQTPSFSATSECDWSAEQPWPALAGRRNSAGAGAPLDPAALQRFKQLMAEERWPVQLARMCYDRLYAYERIAQAHASANGQLRAAALQLFHVYHGLDGRFSGRFDD